jgi:hypothetical protein
MSDVMARWVVPRDVSVRLSLLTYSFSSVLCREDFTSVLVAEGLNQMESPFGDYDYRLLGTSSTNYCEKMLKSIVEHPVRPFRELVRD